MQKRGRWVWRSRLVVVIVFNRKKQDQGVGLLTVPENVRMTFPEHVVICKYIRIVLSVYTYAYILRYGSHVWMAVTYYLDTSTSDHITCAMARMLINKCLGQWTGSNSCNTLLECYEFHMQFCWYDSLSTRQAIMPWLQECPHFRCTLTYAHDIYSIVSATICNVLITLAQSLAWLSTCTYVGGTVETVSWIKTEMLSFFWGSFVYTTLSSFAWSVQT